MAFAVEVVGGTSSTNNASATTVSITVTSANLMLVGVSYGDSLTVEGNAPTVTYAAAAMTLVSGSGSSQGSPWPSVAWYYKTSPAVGTANVSVDPGAPTIDQMGIHVITFIDADIAGTFLGTPATYSNTTANPSWAVGSAAGNIVVSVISTDAQGTGAVNTGTTIFAVQNVGTDTDHVSQYQTASGASTTVTFTAGADGAAGSGVAVLGTGGAAAVSAIPIIDYYYRMIGAKN